MELSDAIKNRYSERDFGDKIPDRDFIERLIEAARLAPNSCNVQVMKFLVVDDVQVRDKVAKIASSKLLWAPINILLMIDSRITIKRSSGIMSLGAAMQNILLTATDMGLAACPMAGFSNDVEIKKELNIPDYYDLMLIIGVGYSKNEKKEISVKEKIPLIEILDWNKYSGKFGLKNLNIDAKKWDIAELIDYRRRIAPVYRYFERFNLGIYSHHVNDELVNQAENIINKMKIKVNILDIDTYDGLFVKELIEKKSKNISVTISSHLDYILNNKNDFNLNLDSLKIDLDNKINSSVKYDLVTCINKFQFIPNYLKLLKSSTALVKDGGYYLIAVDSQSSFKWFLRKNYLLFKALSKREKFNVYENNPYYKQGPYVSVSMHEIDREMFKLGFEKCNSGTIAAKYISKSNQTDYAVYRKK